MNIHHSASWRAHILESLRGSHDLTVIILTGHRLIEELLEGYVRNLVPNQRVLNIELLTFEQKLDLVMAYIDLPLWREEDGCDDVDYRIAEEMLGYIASLNELRNLISLQILDCVQPRVLEHEALVVNVKNQVWQWLALPSDVTDEELKEEALGHVLCVHAYFESFTETMFEEDEG